LIPALLAGIFILDVVTPLGVAVCILYLLPLALTVWIGAQRSPFLVAGNSGRLTAIGLFVSPQAFLQLAIINRSMMLVTLAATALLIWSEKKNRASRPGSEDQNPHGRRAETLDENVGETSR